MTGTLPIIVSFKEYGGPWPTHCVAGTNGAAFSTELKLIAPHQHRFEGNHTPTTNATRTLAQRISNADLRAAGVSRLFVGGLATDYCVFSTVKDALAPVSRPTFFSMQSAA